VLAGVQDPEERDAKSRKQRQRAKVVTAVVVPSAPPAEAQPSADPSPPAAGERPASAASTAAPVPAATVEGSAPQDVLSERIVVREVLLDVLVTDKEGEVVRGLGPEDFLVEEDGEPRAVSGVIFYGGPEELQASGVAGEVRTDRYFILLFDDLLRTQQSSLVSAQLDAGRWTKRWIEDELLPNDQVAVLSYDYRLKVHLDFSRDRAAIGEAIDNAILARRAPDRGRRDDERVSVRDSPSLLVNLPTGKTLRKESGNLEQALELIGQAAEGIVGRKNLILIGAGFGDLAFGRYLPDPRYYPPMQQALNTGNVAVYSLDLLAALGGGPGSNPLGDSLSSLSHDTGGRYYFNFLNAAVPLRAIADDNAGYYLISYRSEHPSGEHGYRKIDVKTRAPGYDVRARTGFRYGQHAETVTVGQETDSSQEN
jgi:VWFA-related protein